MKLRMKISVGFRSKQGTQDFATLLIVLSTACKQGLECIEASLGGPEVPCPYVESQPSPSGPSEAQSPFLRRRRANLHQAGYLDSCNRSAICDVD